MAVQNSVQVPPERCSSPQVKSATWSEEDTMKKLGYVIAALGAIAVAAPTIASAETVVIKRHGYNHDYGRAHAEYRFRDRDHGWGWRHHDRDRVVIKERRGY